MAAKLDPETDDNYYARSTNAFPMDPEPASVFVEGSPDLTKSTMAYPMYDDPADVPARTIEVDHEAQAQSTGEFPTPGPVSSGRPELVAKQRAELGLSDDPTGESDSGYEARPSSVAVPGADGVERDDHQQAEADAAAELQAEDEKELKEATTKVVEPPAKRPTKRTSGAQGS